MQHQILNNSGHVLQSALLHSLTIGHCIYSLLRRQYTREVKPHQFWINAMLIDDKRPFSNDKFLLICKDVKVIEFLPVNLSVMKDL